MKKKINKTTLKCKMFSASLDPGPAKLAQSHQAPDPDFESLLTLLRASHGLFHLSFSVFAANLESFMKARAEFQ